LVNNEKLEKSSEIEQLQEEITKFDEEIKNKLDQYQKSKQDCMCFPFLGVTITRRLVDEIFQELRTKYKDCNGRLNVVVDSGGGDIDAAYNLSMLFRKYGCNELNFLVPRWAKSAATLLVCSGNKIFMSPVAELGPLDPQITEMNPLERRLEQFSPLHVRATLDIIREEFEKGHDKLAKELTQRLQFPITLGRFIKSSDIAEQYLVKLLETRMISGDKKTETAKSIAEKLTKGYADHSFCINIEEAKNIGLNVTDLEEVELDIIWEIHRLNRKREDLKEKLRREKVKEMIKELPPELLDKLPEPISDMLKTEI